MGTRISVVLTVSLGLFIVVAATAGNTLTKQELQKMVRDMDAATAKRDVNGVLQFISPEVRMVTKINGPSGAVQSIAMTYQDYKTALIHFWNAVTEYTYTRDSLNIEISSDQKEATLSAVFRESYAMSGHRVVTVSREVSTVKLINGKPVIVKVYAEQLE